MKLLIYQMFTRLYGNTNSNRKPNGTIEENGCGKFADINDAALESIAKMGFTHVWYTGVIRHASTTDYQFITRKANANVVKGRAGSPYAICDYYDVDPDLAQNVDERMEEFKQLVERTHAHGMKVLIDFVPNHVARNYHSDARPEKQLGESDNKLPGFHSDNNFYYLDGRFKAPVDVLDKEYVEEPAKASGNDAFTTTPSVFDWYETVKLNYGKNYETGAVHVNPMPDTWRKMRDILLFWANQGIDGFRVDMAEMVPVEFWNWVIRQICAKYPHIRFVAETYDPSQYRRYLEAGFNYLYDKVIFYDIVRDVTQGKRPAKDISVAWQQAEGMGTHLLYFVENHDEQRIASDYFAGNFEKSRPAVMLATLFGRGAAMIYFGQELGERGMDKEGFSRQDGRTTIFDYWGIEKMQEFVGDHTYSDTNLSPDTKRIRDWYVKLLNIAQNHDSFSFGNMYDLMWNQSIFVDATKLFCFLRYTEKERVLVAGNFADKDMHTFIRIPEDAWNLLGSTWNECIQPSDMLGNAQVPFQTSVNIVKEKGLELLIPANDGIVLRF